MLKYQITDSLRQSTNTLNETLKDQIYIIKFDYQNFTDTENPLKLYQEITSECLELS